MAIKALEQEPCEDAISRQVAIDVMGGNDIVKDPLEMDDDELTEICERIRLLNAIINLPSVQPKTNVCDDAVNRNLIIQTLNKMDRYVADELTLCDTDKKFPKNEVFIVDDVYEQIVEQSHSVNPQPKIGHWIEHDHGLGTKYYQCSICKGFDKGEKGKYCKWCGTKMIESQESEIERASDKCPICIHRNNSCQFGLDCHFKEQKY